MSLGPTYVLADDGLFYNETLRGPGWFLYFDEDVLPELVIREDDKKQAETKAKKVIEDLGISCRRIGNPSVGYRCFFQNKFGNGVAFLLAIDKPIPARNFRNKGVKRPKCGCTMRTFGKSAEGKS